MDIHPPPVHWPCSANDQVKVWPGQFLRVSSLCGFLTSAEN